MKAQIYFRNHSKISLTIYNDEKFERINYKHHLKDYPGNVFNCDESRFQSFSILLLYVNIARNPSKFVKFSSFYVKKLFLTLNFVLF